MFKAVSMRGAGHFVGGILGKFVKLNMFFYTSNGKHVSHSYDKINERM